MKSVIWESLMNQWQNTYKNKVLIAFFLLSLILEKEKTRQITEQNKLATKSWTENVQYPIICRETFWTVVPAFCVLTCAELWTLLLFPNKPIQETGGSSLQLFNMICLLVFIAERCLLGSIFWELFHYTTQWQSHLSAWIHSLPFSIRQYLSTKILSSKTLAMLYEIINTGAIA